MELPSPRLLLCSTDEILEAQLREQVPYAVLAVCRDPVEVFRILDGQAPDAVLLTDEMVRAGAAGLLARMRVPVVALSSDTSVRSAVRWLRLGAADVRTAESLSMDVLQVLPAARAPLLERFLLWALRAGLTGELRVLEATPLEGLATFDDGLLQHASFCWMKAEVALQEMLAMEDVELSFSAARLVPQASSRTYAPRVLVVEDDAALRLLLTRIIEREGYRVFEAADGLAGYTLAQRERLDVVVTDLDLPKLDGWGLLRALKADAHSREVPVVLLSAHEGAVQTLKAARAGARAYLKKTGRSRELLDAIALLTAPRQRVWTAIRAGLEVPVELGSLGAAWLLEALAELDARGRLELEDELGRYEVFVRDGRFVSAVAQTGSLRVDGVMALEAVVTSRARGRFVFCEVAADAKAPWLFDALARVMQSLSLDAAHRVQEVTRTPRRLCIDDELASLYARVASPRELRLLDALRQQPQSLDELAAWTALPEHDVSRMVGEWLRRGIVAERR